MQNNNKKGGLGRLGDFLAGKGFYIVLFLCVAAIGISGYFLLTDSFQPTQTVANPTQIVVTPPPATPTPALPTITPAPTPTPVPATPTPAPATPSPALTPTPTPTPAPTPAALVFTWPVKGEVLSGHSVETLAYDETMGDWRTHDGVDIAAPAGTQVIAPAGGTISDLYTDDLMGTTVVILHADGVMSTCSNLAAVPTVEIGDPVRTGDVIGSVGTSAIAESAEASHLHLSMTKDGESVDPLGYLPER